MGVLCIGCDLRHDRVVEPPIFAVVLDHENRPFLRSNSRCERIERENDIATSQSHSHCGGLWAS